MALHTGVLVKWGEAGWETSPPARLPPLVIAGSHPNGRDRIPWDDPEKEIWVFNEAPQKDWCRRWDACFQIHRPEVYTSPDNFVQSDHWEWLQQKRDKPIWMYPVDPRVPDAVEYPLEGVLALVPYRYLRSSPAEALALAIYLGYTDITLYGSELTSNTEYHYQAINMAFWIGFAHGRGVDFKLECWQSEFNQRIYGIDGDTQIEREYFASRVEEMIPICAHNERALENCKGRLNEAMLKNEYAKVAELIAECERLAQSAGETEGVLAEARKYADRETHTPRQEYERTSAQAQIDGESAKEKLVKESGKTEYVWNVWRQTGNLAALNQLRTFVKAQMGYALETGARLGAHRENFVYLGEYDARVTAAGGEKALIAAGMNPAGRNE